jgi:hypothetical protein
LKVEGWNDTGAEKHIQNFMAACEQFRLLQCKEHKGLSSFLDFMCPLPVLRRLAIGFPVSFPRFLLSSESNSRVPQAHDDLLLRKSGNEGSKELCSF